MSLETLGSIRTRAKYRANMENSTFVTDSEWNTYINSAMKELYDLLVSHYGEDYFVTSLDFAVTNGTHEYSLPSDFYKLIGLDMQLDSQRRITVKKFEFAERNRKNIVPTVFAGNTCTLWYIPQPVSVSADASTIQGYAGWEDYIVIKAAIVALTKEESDTSALNLELANMKKRVEDMSDARDAGMPSRITDINAGEFYEDGLMFDEINAGFWNNLRYRLRGAYIIFK